MPEAETVPAPVALLLEQAQEALAFERERAEKAEAGRDRLAREIAEEADDLAAEAAVLFPMMDSDIRRILSVRLRKMLAGTGAVAAGAESNAGGRKDSGTADGMPEGGAAA